MELTIIWLAAAIIASIAFVIAVVSYIKVSDLEKQVDELSDWLDVLTDLTVDTFEELEEKVDNKFDDVLDLINDNHIIHDKMIKVMESLISTDESLYEYIQDVEKTEQFDRDDLFELFTDFFAGEVEECPKAKTCKKEPCKDTCPKKRGRPAKK